MLGLATFTPMFVGPLGFLLFTLLVIIGILIIARLVFAVAWKVILVGAVVLGLLWLLGVFRFGPPGLT